MQLAFLLLRTKVNKLTSYKYSSSKMATSSNSTTGKRSASSQPGAMSSSYSSGHNRQSRTSLTTFSSPPTKPVETRYDYSLCILHFLTDNYKSNPFPFLIYEMFGKTYFKAVIFL